MNVLIVFNNASEYGGNLVSSVRRLALELEKAGGRAVFLLPREVECFTWAEEMAAREQVFFKKELLNSRNSRDVHEDYELYRHICEEYEIDIIHIHFWNLNDCKNIARIKKQFPRIRSIIHHHNEYHVSTSRIRELIKRRMIGRHYHVGVSRAVADGLIAAGFPNDSVFALDNAIEYGRLDRFEPYELPENTFLMLSSYSEHAKGIDLAVQAIGELNSEGANLSLAIVSRRPEDTEKYIKGVLDAENIKGELPGWIIILPIREDIATYYRAAAYFLSASRNEGFCYAVLEAIYCGRETIQSRIAPHRLDVPECITFESENASDLAGAIRQLIYDDPQEQRCRLEAQRKYVISQYGIEKWCQGMLDIYGKCV